MYAEKEAALLLQNREAPTSDFYCINNIAVP